jgi:hypothetical protein
MLGVGDGVLVGVADGVGDGVLVGVADGVGDGVGDGVLVGVGDGVLVGVGVGVKFAPCTAESGRALLCGSVGTGGISRLTPRESTRSSRTASGLAARSRRAGTSYLAAMLFHDSPACTT